MNFWRCLAIIGYPLLIVASLWLQQPQLRSLGLPLLAIAVIGPIPRSRSSIGILLISCMLAVLVLYQPSMALWPPSLLCLSASVWFGQSLLPGKIPLIKRFAMIVLHSHGHVLPQKSETWMRFWTWLWTALMAMSGMVAVGLSIADRASVWSIWMMLVVPISMLTLLLLEFYLRRHRFPDQPRWSPVYFLRTVVRIPPHKITG